MGFMGRLGNQMFQYAALYSISKKYNLKFVLNTTALQIYKCFKLPAEVSSKHNNDFVLPHGLQSDIIKNTYSIDIKTEEQNCIFLNTAFDIDFYETNHDNKSLVGFFQNYKYFIDFQDNIRNEYIFKDKYINIVKFYFNQRFPDSKVISLHIRRSDYLNSYFLNCLDLQYYKNALKYFKESLPVLIFSDDPSWCREQDLFKHERFFIINSQDTYVDLCMMSMCNYHIIANSTYSWWGSWLAKSEKTICPKQWFQPYASFLDSDGLRLPNWISI